MKKLTKLLFICAGLIMTSNFMFSKGKKDNPTKNEKAVVVPVETTEVQPSGDDTDKAK